MPRHVACFTYGLWGHLRPQISFVSRLIMAEPGIVVSLIFDTRLMDPERVRGQLTLDLGGKSSENVHFYTMQKSQLFHPEGIESEFEEVYANFLQKTTIQPDAFVGEIGPYDTAAIVRKLSTEKTPKFIFWYPGPLSALYGHVHRWGDDIDRLMDIDFMAMPTFDENKKLQIAGFPLISGNEMFPQPITQQAPFQINVLVEKSTAQWLASDAMLGGTSDILEPEQIKQIRSLAQARGKDLFAIGDVGRPTDPAAVDPALSKFLDAKAPKSVLYIGFGSLTTHDSPEKFHAFMDVVLELNIPFVIAHGPRSAPLPENVASSPNGLVLPWAPQEYILQHPSTGLFLSHAGFTSVKESLSAGVPLLCWPLQYDQPLVAIMACQVLKCGIELEEVRSGPLGLQKRGSNGHTPKGTIEAVKEEAKDVLQKAFFDQSVRAELSANVQRVQSEMAQAWQPGGVSDAELKRFLQLI